MARLTPEAQARLAAARAIAQGKPPPASAPRTVAGGAPARAVPPRAAGGTAPQAHQQQPSQPPTGSGAKVALVAIGMIFVSLLAGGLAWISLGRKPDLLGTTASLQRTLLDGKVSGTDGKKAIAAVIRNADQMTKTQLEEARKALDDDWQKSRDEAIDTFFAAPEGDRSRLADLGIDHTIAYRKLRFGLSPQARSDDGRKQQPPADADRLKLFNRYAAAILAKAKTRGVDLPEWR